MSSPSSLNKLQVIQKNMGLCCPMPKRLSLCQVTVATRYKLRQQGTLYAVVHIHKHHLANHVRCACTYALQCSAAVSQLDLCQSLHMVCLRHYCLCLMQPSPWSLIFGFRFGFGFWLFSKDCNADTTACYRSTCYACKQELAALLNLHKQA